MVITKTDIGIGAGCVIHDYPPLSNVLWWTTHSKNWHHLMGLFDWIRFGPSVLDKLITGEY